MPKDNTMILSDHFLTIRLPLGKAQSILIPGRIVAVFLLCIILAVPSLLEPDHPVLPDCYFKRYTGYSCPSCGLTHSFYETSHFYFREAFRHHILGPAIYIFLLLMLLKYLIEMFTLKQISIGVNTMLKKTVLIILGSVWLGFWLIRFLGELKT
ncbi:MAG: DUF2752 domain-containing protein [Bacteroidales bacterium]|nr:MAG: DUF2752 domain-containing protein [Bacteroidales bacterium]